jgi:hypothetical protein
MTTDEQQTETTEKRGPGRPRGSSKRVKPPPVRRDSVHRGPHHHAADDGQGDILEGFEYRPYEQENVLAIDPDIVRGIERDWGYSLLWVCFEANGKPFPNLVSARRRNGYADVHRGNFGGALDHLCDRDGNIVREGLRLMARPVEIQRMAEQHDKRAAKAAVDHMKASHQSEGLNVSMPGGGDHPSALRQNRHRSTFEPGRKFRSDHALIHRHLSA